jgi:hypothetical protein
VFHSLCPHPQPLEYPEARDIEVDDEARRRDAEGDVFREEYAVAAEERRKEEAAALAHRAVAGGALQPSNVQDREDPPAEDDESRRRGAEGAAFAEEYAAAAQERRRDMQAEAEAAGRVALPVEDTLSQSERRAAEARRDNLRAALELNGGGGGDPRLRPDQHEQSATARPTTARPTTASPTTAPPTTAAPSTAALSTSALTSSCLPLPENSKISSAVARAKTPECKEALTDAYCKLQNGTLLPTFQPCVVTIACVCAWRGGVHLQASIASCVIVDAAARVRGECRPLTDLHQ